jgi:arabinose-5-phosphate isomerase
MIPVDQILADLAAGRATLAAERAGLAALEAALDHRFAEAVALLAAVQGRVIVSGMGKSGHIARKIAATLASTGTPAHFVHPGEASHGDLGMIVAGDVVLALSNSGETAELADLTAHARRFAIPLIAITANADSALALAADTVLKLPEAEEACPIGLAPTTSTTMQLALGDALAVALLRRRGFTPAEFQTFHPGGKLGARLKHVRDLMHKGALPLVPPELPMRDVLLTITQAGFGCAGVAENGKLTGIITDGDLRRAMGVSFLDARADAVMTRNPRTISPDQLAVDALVLMNDAKRPVTSLFVVDAQAAPVGLLHVHDLLRAGLA